MYWIWKSWVAVVKIRLALMWVNGLKRHTGDSFYIIGRMMWLWISNCCHLPGLEITHKLLLIRGSRFCTKAQRTVDHLEYLTCTREPCLLFRVSSYHRLRTTAFPEHPPLCQKRRSGVVHTLRLTSVVSVLWINVFFHMSRVSSVQGWKTQALLIQLFIN